LQKPGGNRAAPADRVGVQGRWCVSHDQQREKEQRDPRHSGWAARQGAQVEPGATGDEEHGDEEPVAERVQLRAEDWVAGGIAVNEVEHHPGEESIAACLSPGHSRWMKPGPQAAA